MSNWMIIESFDGIHTMVDLDKIVGIKGHYVYDKGWSDEALCHIYPTTFISDTGVEIKASLNQRGYETLLKMLKPPPEKKPRKKKSK